MALLCAVGKKGIGKGYADADYAGGSEPDVVASGSRWGDYAHHGQAEPDVIGESQQSGNDDINA